MNVFLEKYYLTHFEFWYQVTMLTMTVGGMIWANLTW